jgi:hypothetical protein
MTKKKKKTSSEVFFLFVHSFIGNLGGFPVLGAREPPKGNKTGQTVG